MSRAYRYAPANQSLRMLAEDEDMEDTKLQDSDDDMDAGSSRRNKSTGKGSQSPQTKSPRRVAWSSPNDRSNDDNQESDDDGEVPPSFMIEEDTGSSKRKKSKGKGKGKERNEAGSGAGGRSRPLYSVGGGRKLSSILPTHAPPPPPQASVSVPPRPSELDVEGEDEDEQHTPRASGYHTNWRTTDPMLGLDPHERALWNWVNVVNLDAFLQEAYYYYEGKGLYSIALARGLNLLLVHHFLRSVSFKHLTLFF